MESPCYDGMMKDNVFDKINNLQLQIKSLIEDTENETKKTSENINFLQKNEKYNFQDSEEFFSSVNHSDYDSGIDNSDTIETRIDNFGLNTSAKKHHFYHQQKHSKRSTKPLRIKTRAKAAADSSCCGKNGTTDNFLLGPLPKVYDEEDIEQLQYQMKMLRTENHQRKEQMSTHEKEYNKMKEKLEYQVKDYEAKYEHLNHKFMNMSQELVDKNHALRHHPTVREYEVEKFHEMYPRAQARTFCEWFRWHTQDRNNSLDHYSQQYSNNHIGENYNVDIIPVCTKCRIAVDHFLQTSGGMNGTSTRYVRPNAFSKEMQDTYSMMPLCDQYKLLWQQFTESIMGSNDNTFQNFALQPEINDESSIHGSSE